MQLGLSDQDILEKLRKGETNVMKYCYTRSFGLVSKMIVQKGGSRQDAEDIFQDALVIFYKNCLKPDFVLSSAISTYLYAIAWRLYMKELRTKNGSATLLDENLAVIDAFDFELAEHQRDAVADILDVMEKVGKNCKEILIFYYFNKLSLEQIAQRLDTKDARAIREQKYRCMKRIKEALNPADYVR